MTQDGPAVPPPSPVPPPREHPLTLISPSAGWQWINVRELWQHRELVYFFAWRDVKIRYKQTLLGAGWAVLQPALMMVVFTIFFGRMARVSSGDLPYPLFAYAGLVAWTFFATAISQAGNSVVGSERLITKVYLPRLSIPFAAAAAAAADFVIALGLLLGMMVYYHIPPTPSLLLVPLIFGLLMVTALGIGTLLAALNVAYRDFRYVIPFLVQVWLFATPSVYMNIDDQVPTATAGGAAATTTTTGAPAAPIAARPAGPGPLKTILALNPLIPLIAAFRAATLGGTIPWGPLGLAAISSVLMFLAGCFYFRRVEDNFADIV